MCEKKLARQIQEKSTRKSFRVSDSATSGISEDSAIEVQENLVAFEELTEENPAPLFQRSIRRNSYNNPLTNAEILIDDSKTLFRSLQ